MPHLSPSNIVALLLFTLLLTLASTQPNPTYVISVDCKNTTLRDAQLKIRSMQPLTQPVSVLLKNGALCTPPSPDVPVLALDGNEGDSGTSSEATVTWGVEKGGKALISGGVALDGSKWKFVSSGGQKMYKYDLTGINLGHLGYGKITNGGLGNCHQSRVELFFNNKPMILARYPNVNSLEKYNGPWMDWMHVEIPDGKAPHSFVTKDDRPGRWATIPSQQLQQGWLHGFWAFDWADNYIQLESIAGTKVGPTKKGWEIQYNESTPPVYEIKKGARFYALNLFDELDAPGEYFIDETSNTLFFIPPTSDFRTKPMYLSVASQSLITAIHNVQHVIFRGFSASFSRESAIAVSSSSHLVFEDLDLSNHGHSALAVTGSSNVLVNNVKGKGLGCSASVISGGYHDTLVPGNITVQNCEFSSFARWTRTYNPGIHFSGVGNTFTGNTVAEGPHTGMTGGGNNLIFRNNLFVNLCFEARDAGAWYVGRSWTNRGLVLDHNTFINISAVEPTALGAGVVQAMYFDDQQSGVTATNNVCQDSDNCFLVGGGRDNTVKNNTCARVKDCVLFDDRGLNWQKEMCKENKTNPSKSGELVLQLFSVHYQKPPYSKEYPRIVNTLSDRPCTPVDNLFEGNRWCKVSAGVFLDRSNATVNEWGSKMLNNNEYTDC